VGIPKEKDLPGLHRPGRFGELAPCGMCSFGIVASQGRQLQHPAGTGPRSVGAWRRVSLKRSGAPPKGTEAVQPGAGPTGPLMLAGLGRATGRAGALACRPGSSLPGKVPLRKLACVRCPHGRVGCRVAGRQGRPVPGLLPPPGIH